MRFPKLMTSNQTEFLWFGKCVSQMDDVKPKWIFANWETHFFAVDDAKPDRINLHIVAIMLYVNVLNKAWKQTTCCADIFAFPNKATKKPLQWISTHFGRAGLETSWELGFCIPEFAVSLLLEPIKLRTLKWTLQVWLRSSIRNCELRLQVQNLSRTKIYLEYFVITILSYIKERRFQMKQEKISLKDG